MGAWTLYTDCADHGGDVSAQGDRSSDEAEESGNSEIVDWIMIFKSGGTMNGRSETNLSMLTTLQMAAS